MESYYSSKGINSLPKGYQICLPESSVLLAESMFMVISDDDPSLINRLTTHHWLMCLSPREELASLLTTYPPGTMLIDLNDQHWIRRSKMIVTRHRFISSVGDDQEQYYQQKFLLTVALTPKSDVVENPPKSWVDLCVQHGMCDGHLDALSCLQSAVSRGFHTDRLRSLAQLYVENGFLQADEADEFLCSIPVIGEMNESECTVSDQMLSDPASDTGDLLKYESADSLPSLVDSFTESQLRAFRWIEANFENHRQVCAAVVGPAGTGKSYLLKGIIELAKSQKLVVTKLAPSGVAAHLIGDTTIHNFFALDINCNSSLENGTLQVAKLRKTDVLVIDEFSMLDFLIFRTAEGLCRKYAKQTVSSLPWGGRHVILLGDPAQLPAVSRSDIFSTQLWRSFSILMLRESKMCTDSDLSRILAKIRLGECDQDVIDTLSKRVQPRNIDDLELNKTVVICSTRAECEEINAECLMKLDSQEAVYESLDTDHHGHPLREADFPTACTMPGKTTRSIGTEGRCTYSCAKKPEH